MTSMMRAISSNLGVTLTITERAQLEVLHKRGYGPLAIGKELGCANSTVSRERNDIAPTTENPWVLSASLLVLIELR